MVALSLNSISVDRTKNAMSSMMVLKDKLITEKAVVVIYPEGTRTPTGNMYFGKMAQKVYPTSRELK